jgi:hypothetical protein
VGHVNECPPAGADIRTKIYRNLMEIYQKRRYRQHRIGHTEPKNIIMSKEQKTTEFVVFCIENTATRLKKEGYDVFRELAKTNGIEGFLYPSFPTLHTQSKEYIG